MSENPKMDELKERIRQEVGIRVDESLIEKRYRVGKMLIRKKIPDNKGVSICDPCTVAGVYFSYNGKYIYHLKHEHGLITAVSEDDIDSWEEFFEPNHNRLQRIED